MMPMRFKTTSLFVCVALGLFAPACDDETEDPNGVPWIPGNGDPTDAGGGSSGESDSASSWGESDDSDTWGSAGGETTDTTDGSGNDSDPGESAGESSGGDDSAGESTGGDNSDSDGAGGDSPYVGGWDVGACDDASGPGDSIVGTDQNGDSVYLRDFCHKAVLLVLGNFT